MVGLPTLDEYNAAVQNPQLAFISAPLKSGVVETTGLGLPRALGGGFAITYTVKVGNRKYAIRCFHRSVPKLGTTYHKISSVLCSDTSSIFVGFEYQHAGILVNGNRFPIVKMDWADGKTLGAWLEDNFNNRASLDQLRRQFREVEAHLRARRCAHGDLQNGNVIVNGHLRLIDYDGIYVPGLPVGQGTELGHKHFQHPKRSTANFGPDMDRFSFIVIDLSLEALIEDPTLFSRYSNGENIIFSASDFHNPSASALFQELLRLPALHQSTRRLAHICTGTIDQVPTLSDFLSNRSIPSVSIRAAPIQQQGPASYVGAFDVLSAADFTAVKARIGDRVELIGAD